MKRNFLFIEIFIIFVQEVYVSITKEEHISPIYFKMGRGFRSSNEKSLSVPKNNHLNVR